MKKSKLGRISRRNFVGTAAAGFLAASLNARGARGSNPEVAARDALRLAENRREELISLLSDLIRIQSISGDSASEAQDIVGDYLQALPVDVRRYADRPSRYENHIEFTPPQPPGDGPFDNIVGHPTGSQGDRFAVFAHIDTHAVEDGWSTDPYKPVIRGNRLYGLGSADDKGGVAAMLVAASIIANEGGNLPIVISHHGKGGGSRGSLPVFERFRKDGTSIRGVLYSHPAETGAGFAHIKNFVMGVLDFSLTVKGWRGKPLEIGLPDSVPWSESGDALNFCLGAIDRLRAGPLKGRKLNVGSLCAGNRIGSVPASAVAEMRVLFGPDDNWHELYSAVETELKRFAETRSSSFDWTLAKGGMRSNAGAVGWNSAKCTDLRESIQSITEITPMPYENHFGGDIRFPIRMLEAPAFGIGSIGGNFYGPNEWVDIDDLVRLVAVLVNTLMRWSTTSESS